MSDTITNPIAELEAQFNLEIPCGGNNSPVERPCPHDAPATLISLHFHTCDPVPKALKCDYCYEEWASILELSSQYVECVCGARIPAGDWYRPL